MSSLRWVTAGRGSPRPREVRSALWRAGLRTAATLTWLTTALVVLSGALSAAFLLLSARTVAAIPAAVHGGLGSATGHRLLVLLGTTTGVFLLLQLVGPVLSAMADELGKEVEFRLGQQLVTAVLAQDDVLALHESKTATELATADGLSTGVRPGTAITALVTVWSARMQSVCALLVLAAFQPWTALGLAVVYGWAIRFWQGFYRFVTSWATRRGPELRRADYFRDTAMRPAAAKEIRVFGLSDWFPDRFHETWRAGMAPVWRSWRSRNAAALTAVLVPAAATGGALLLTGRAATDGVLTLAACLVVVQTVLAASASVGLNDQDLVVSAGRVSASASLAVCDRFPGEVRSAPAPARRTPPRLEFRDVRFAYPKRPDRPVLAGLDLDVPAGTSLALVGLNGAGKSTLVHLLCGAYTPDSGRILADGEPVTAHGPRSWQAELAVVFQDSVRLGLSLADNVAPGAPRDAATWTELEAVLADAGLPGLAARLPHGLDTPLRPDFDGGVDLSGGQWQRIALARLLFRVRRGATTVVLDEPTAALDVRAEAELFARLLELTAGLTRILISHRFATVRGADRIAVLDGGRITELGTHDQLLATGGSYATMFTQQAARLLGE